MNGSQIKKVFKKAGVAVPSNIDVFAFDDTQSWCCGYWAGKTEEGVILQKYCLKRRGTSHMSVIDADGDIVSKTLLDSDSQPGELDLVLDDYE